MRCYSPAYYHHGLTTTPPPPPPPPPPPTRAHCYNYYYYPFNGSKPAKYPTRRLVAKAAASSSAGGGDGFAVVAAESRVSLYEVLGVAESGTVGEVKQAYKQMARKYHPDVSPPGRVEEYTRRFILVQQAYETLSDPARRALYDRDMAKGLHFAFSARRPFHYDIHQVTEQRNEWKTRWQSQLSELKRRSKCKDGGASMPWAARMRNKQRDELVNVL